MVFFISSPGHAKRFSWKITKPDGNIKLNVVTFSTPIPTRLRFYIPWLYKVILRRYLRLISEAMSSRIDVCIDFGCYQMFNNLGFVKAPVKIFFPVDDHALLEPVDRGSHLILSVSENVVHKFRSSGKPCHFINHGLSDEFAEVAQKRMLSLSNHEEAHPTKIAYAGNLFIDFLDIPVFRTLIERNPRVQFHLFGSLEYDSKIRKFKEWNDFLKQSSNVTLYGIVHPSELAIQYAKMDGFLLCYQPDYRNYHGENSHKVFEYLSTGKVIFSTYLSLYRDNPLIKMSPKSNNHLLPEIFEDAIGKLEQLNSVEQMKKRIELALNNTYKMKIEQIQTLICVFNEKNQFHNQPESRIGEWGMGRD
jgi:glycosyltransferase involved in cell wall biosynthesis